ncbi:uncharacterized protein LOC131930202 [Physella acuta]|uniref:uncharacterized protein LOC131930202 n=1 Tax=Physella acuta TaxID=109671 RepID=UPI0027DD2663|nr:uncharacterized protein LOC131930202 [Physella acuta]
MESLEDYGNDMCSNLDGLINTSDCPEVKDNQTRSHRRGVCPKWTETRGSSSDLGNTSSRTSENTPSLQNSDCNSSISIAHLLKNWHLTSVFFLLVVAVMSCHLPHTEAKSVGVCNGIPCANGGRLLVSNSVWGNCRCRCPSGFVGPYCQYEAARKRSAPRLVSSKPFRSETLERIKRRLELLRQLYEARQDVETNEVINDPLNVDVPALYDSPDTYNLRPRRSFLTDDTDYKK